MRWLALCERSASILASQMKQGVKCHKLSMVLTLILTLIWWSRHWALIQKTYLHAPYKVIQVEHAEADDVIGTICHAHGQQLGGDPILILSGDKDFQQLQEYANIEQYSPILKKFIKCNDPQGYLLEHILKGDRGDGVPNILSPGDVFVSGGRQKPMSKKKMSEFMQNPPIDYARFQENAMLVASKPAYRSSLYKFGLRI